ncbi:hypothetical protein DMUE_1087 [Dictyocoela muelleri]|nr:hypothetical protein DMUE_1087 [Dictyocoela muelleri]
MKIIKSNKGKNKIINNQFIYNYDHTGKEFISWRCVRRNCSGRLKTDISMKVVIDEKLHWHDVEDQKINKMLINNKLKNLADNINEPFEYALKAAYANVSHENKECLLNYKILRDCFKKRRNNKFNTDTNDINIPSSYKFTFSNEQFLQFDSGKSDSDRILIFSTDKNISYVKKSYVWL